MSITGTIAAVGAIGSSIAGGITQSSAAQNAASAQQSYAQQAQALEQQNQQSGVNFQNQEWTGQQAAEQPYQQLGRTSANAYANLLKNPFTAPTAAQAAATPGEQFELQQGTQAINEHAAATGNLSSGNTGVALEQYGQGLASTTYQQAYQNALNTYNTNLGAAATGVNTGLNSTAQLGQFGQSAANNLSNLYLQGGQQQASQLNNQGAAIASGDIGSANAYSNMFNGISNGVTQGLTMNAIGNQLSANNYAANEPVFNGGSVGGTSNPALATPGAMPVANPYANISTPAPYSPLNVPGLQTASLLGAI
jgi:hypothetical protein